MRNSVCLTNDTANSIGKILYDIYVSNLPAVKSDTAAIKVMTDKIGTLTNSGGTASLGVIIGDVANADLVTRIADIHADVGLVRTELTYQQQTDVSGYPTNPVSDQLYTVLDTTANVEVESLAVLLRGYYSTD
jgi:hypothetical protein